MALQWLCATLQARILKNAYKRRFRHCAAISGLPHLPCVNCGARFLARLELARFSAFFQKTHTTGAFRTALRRATTSFAPSKLLGRFSCAPKIRSLLCVFTFQRTTLTSASLRRLRTRLLVWHKNPSVLCVFCLPSTDIGREAPERKNKKNKKDRKDRNSCFSCPSCPSCLSCHSCPPILSSPPLVHGYLF